MNSLDLIQAWKEEPSMKNIVKLVEKTADNSVLHIDNVNINDIVKLKKNIVIHINDDNNQFVIECKNFIEQLDIDNDSLGYGDIDIMNENDIFKIIILLKNNNCKTIYCKSASIIDKSVNTYSFL